MEYSNETKNDTFLKACTSCGSTANKFKQKGKNCIKCYSKINNQKFKDKDYFKQYYLEHKPVKETKPLTEPIEPIEPTEPIDSEKAE